MSCDWSYCGPGVESCHGLSPRPLAQYCVLQSAICLMCALPDLCSELFPSLLFWFISKPCPALACACVGARTWNPWCLRHGSLLQNCYAISGGPFLLPSACIGCPWLLSHLPKVRGSSPEWGPASAWAPAVSLLVKMWVHFSKPSLGPHVFCTRAVRFPDT